MRSGKGHWMADRATPNLPSSDLDRTEAFYGNLGFETGFKDDGWMILRSGDIQLEFFPHAVDPRESIASCCVRVDDLDALYRQFAQAGLPASCWSTPRLIPPVDEPWGMRMCYLVDPDGNLIRCIHNTEPASAG